MRAARGGFGQAELYLSVAALLGTFACTGVVSSGDPSGDAPTVTPPGSTPGTVVGNNGGSGPVRGPGRGEMHRLNTVEYNATVADVLGTRLQPANANWRGGEIEGFDNVASVLGVDETQFGLYVEAAESLAADVFKDATLKAKIVTCSKQDDTACVQDIIAKTGLRVFRRPLRQDEIATYQKVYAGARSNGQDHEGSVKHVLWSLLSSAEFLYRIELPKGSAARPLDGFELASRLSYFLWSSAPDDALLTAAGNNALLNDGDVKSAVDRMLTDAKSQRFIENFAGQWLGARKLATHPVALERFPDWSEAVGAAAVKEVQLFFNEFLRKDKPWTDFLKADINFVNAPLAKLYGIPNVTSMDLMQVSNTTDQRKGFMGLVGFLTVSSMDRRTSPTLRGKWVLGNLLCQEPPPPPADVPKLDVGGKDLDNGNIRAILTAHRVRPDCAACHGLFDPFGLALEKYDAVGRYRETYGDKSAIDVKTELKGVAFEDLDGAVDIVTNTPAFKTCFAHKLFTYGLGRAPAGDDEAWLQQIGAQWESSGLTVRQLVDGLTQSVPFRNSGDVK